MAVISKRHNYSVVSLDILADMFHNVGRRFKDLGNDIDDVFIIGDWLASPFKYFGDWFLYVEGKVREANRFIKDVLDWTYTIVDGYGFIDLLKWSSTLFRYLYTDPRYFIYKLISDYYIEGVLIYTSPSQWVVNRLRSKYGWFYDFLIDPRAYVINRIISYSYWFLSFLNDPRGYIIGRIISYVSWFSLFLNNPTSFIIQYIARNYQFFTGFLLNPRQYIINQIALYSPFLANLINLRERWIYELVRLVLNLPASFLTNPIGAIFDALLNLLDISLIRYSERIKKIVIDFIIYFV